MVGMVAESTVVAGREALEEAVELVVVSWEEDQQVAAAASAVAEAHRVAMAGAMEARLNLVERRKTQ